MNYIERGFHRRKFLKTGLLAASSSLLTLQVGAETKAGEQDSFFSGVGLAGSLDSASVFKEAGVDFLTLGVGNFLIPEKSEEEFERQLKKLQEAPLPMLACNGFIRPRDLHSVGPNATHERLLEWSDLAFRRLKKAGGRFMVFGSSGARRIPDGWPRAKAEEQFVELLKRMGPLAEKHGITVAVEQLQEKECNFINHIEQAAKLIRATGHPSVRLLADLYHMRVMGDTPEDLAAAMDVVVHAEIAEKENRTYPGVDGDDFRPYFRVMREKGYSGAICIEGRGKPAQVAEAIRVIKQQAREA